MSDSWPSLELLSNEHINLDELFDEYAEFRWELFNHTCCNPQAHASSSYVVGLVSKLNMIIDTLKNNVPRELMERNLTPHFVPDAIGSFEDPIPISSSEDEACSTDTEDVGEQLTEYDTSMDEDDGEDEDDDSMRLNQGYHYYPPSPIDLHRRSSSERESDLFNDHKLGITPQRPAGFQPDLSGSFQKENMYRESRQRATINNFADGIDHSRKFRRDYQNSERLPDSLVPGYYGINVADAGALSFEADPYNAPAWALTKKFIPPYYDYASGRIMATPQPQDATPTSHFEDNSSTVTAVQESRLARPVMTPRDRPLRRPAAVFDSVQIPQPSKRRRVE
ncbi:hypothetical protein N7456_003417 [Penicillium angulare]|uniref:Uncharacterized protein n=1 Tax=Penicillium angulare TaxID=116970 RepID=A0A9W9KIQ5_9EURO|nr:hypothetical protein N7456_003417 [Penicillium angulare]